MVQNQMGIYRVRKGVGDIHIGHMLGMMCYVYMGYAEEPLKKCPYSFRAARAMYSRIDLEVWLFGIDWEVWLFGTPDAVLVCRWNWEGLLCRPFVWKEFSLSGSTQNGRRVAWGS